ncbi:NAD-binding protein [Halospeciosus flavus]|uniref:NAD-binding protein n=1 Tax=Halospeciosus flavus TaxID=3032283 RepID=A0ABD5Z8S8_9EURY|nr:NAD-binding protein [Halospeciosus flavus]
MELSRQSVTSSRIAVALTMAVALLSVATGVVNIDRAAHFGPFAGAVPPAVQQTAGFTGALTGFLMVASALGMRRGLRAAWYSTAILLPVTALQGLVQGSVYSIPLVALSVAAMPTVWYTRSRFDRSLELTTTQLAAAIALVGVLVYGTLGTYALREGFNTGESMSLLDAFYYTLVTASTVGYGDVTPVTAQARLFGLSVLVLGVASFGIALSALLAPAIEARFSSALGMMTQSELETLENHVIVAGYGELTEPILNELRDAGTPYVVVTPSKEAADVLNARDIKVVVGDPTDEDILDRAGLDRARAFVAATNDDGEDALAVLTARQLNEDVRIVAAVTDRENEAKLRRAGADTVVSPAALGGRLLVRSALDGEDAEALADEVYESD